MAARLVRLLVRQHIVSIGHEGSTRSGKIEATEVVRPEMLVFSDRTTPVPADRSTPVPAVSVLRIPMTDKNVHNLRPFATRMVDAPGKPEDM
jgi:hypothetical protein